MEKIDSFLTELASLLPSSRFTRDVGECEYYAQDWSRTLTAFASAVVFPENTDEVSQVLSLALRHRIPVVPSGGRTGLSGGAVATRGEVILSTLKMNRIGPVHAGSLTLQVQAGAITQSVHEHCSVLGLTWPVDFASKGSSTVGGNIATNAGGIRVIRYGNTRNWVLGLTAVSMDGTIHRFNRDLEKNNTGYDFRQLLTGSEGTLGVITEATLKLCPLPKSTSLFFFALEDFKQLLGLFDYARSKFPGLSAFECLDHASLSAVLGVSGEPLPLSTPGKVYALMELENTPDSESEEGLTGIFENGLALDGIMARNDTEKKRLWHYREGVAEAILTGHLVHQEDVSVPVRTLGEFYTEIEERYASTLPGFEVFFFGHIGDGNLHIFIRKPETMSADQFRETAKDSDFQLFRTLEKYHGSISAEHGIGLLKKHAIGFSRSQAEIELMRGIKQGFDPLGLLNPGKIFDQTR
jgi:FAD/FMN-containing dehydrogenase